MRPSRRRFLGSAALALAARAAPASAGAEARVISRDANHYHGWPTLARTRTGRLLLAYSGGRESHVCPFGRVELMTSDDDGANWSWPQVLLDSPIDDRDSGVVEAADGSLLATTFTSLAYEEPNRHAQDPEAWRAVEARTTPEQRKSLLGTWMLRSEDGLLWSQPYRVPVNSPHGPALLDDGRLLYAGKELWTQQQRIGVAESSDHGRTWSRLAAIPARPGDDHRAYHELHVVDAGRGRLVAHIRNHNKVNDRETLQTESDDGGKTWSVPRGIGVWGLPSHLVKLKDGRLVMSYGYRREPYGNQARVSDDRGATWSDPITISADGASGDLGYPSTVELADGALLTVWYEKLASSPKAVLRQAIWRL